jgi:peptide/nickel transport system ATP-binding protein
MTAMNTILRAENLSKTFSGAGLLRRSPVPALKNINLEIVQGDIFGLVGESGSGKTTLARTILFLETPGSGHVYFKGVDLSSLSARALRKTRGRMQIIFQDPHGALDPRLTIRQSMEEGLKNFGVPKEERAGKVKKLLVMVGIPWSQEAWYPTSFPADKSSVS